MAFRDLYRNRDLADMVSGLGVATVVLLADLAARRVAVLDHDAKAQARVPVGECGILDTIF